MPLPLLQTESALLRAVQLADVDALHQLWTTPEVRRYLWDHVIISRDTAEQVIESHLDIMHRLGIGYWLVHEPSPAQGEAPVAGFCGFRIMDEGPEIELMYGLLAEYWGKGIATEACGAALEYLWRETRYQQVYARTDPPNQRSVRVMVRLGMRHMSTTPSMITYMLRRPG